MRKTPAIIFPLKVGGILRVLTSIALLLSSLIVQSQTIHGAVIAVVDGNTLQVSSRNKDVYQVVLQGIDCPELTQDFGIKAKTFVEARLLHEPVVVHLYGKDRNKNYIGVVLTMDSTDVRLTVLQEGLAWTRERNPPEDLEAVREEAASKKRGLWKDGDPTPPWIYRRQNSMSTPKSR